MGRLVAFIRGRKALRSASQLSHATRVLGLIAAALGPLVGSVTAHDIITTQLTYTHEISRIFARRCISCHDEGSSIPLTRYDEVRPWAVDIKEQVLARLMPPRAPSRVLVTSTLTMP
jgi:hypothetical protein